MNKPCSKCATPMEPRRDGKDYSWWCKMCHNEENRVIPKIGDYIRLHPAKNGYSPSLDIQLRLISLDDTSFKVEVMRGEYRFTSDEYVRPTGYRSNNFLLKNYFIEVVTKETLYGIY